MMNRYLNLILVLLLFSAEAFAQMDSPYQRARQNAHQGRYQEAGLMLESLLKENPDHYDALFLQALITAWDGEYMPALRQLNILMRMQGATAELMEAISRINYWAGENKKAIVAAEKGLNLYPGNTTLMYLRSRALAAEQEYDTAITGLEELLQLTPADEEAKALLKRLEVERLKNTAGIEYMHARFSNSFSPWNQVTASYARKMPSILLIGRLKYAQMFNQQGVQAEVDTYPTINDKTYAYLNAGVSGAGFFPAFRWGAEMYREFHQKWEASVGMRGLYFENAPVHIYTVQLGRYFPAFWVSARGLLTTLQGNSNLSGLFTFRRFIEHEDHFISVYLGNGATPQRINSLIEIQRLDASWVGLDYQHPLGDRTWLMRSALEIQQEVYPEVRTTNRISFSLHLAKRF
jgi:YaiO family outer membrane protein